MAHKKEKTQNRISLDELFYSLRPIAYWCGLVPEPCNLL